MAREPAAIRYKNPGAMWPNKIATKWGSKSWVALNDGTGQGNKIAVFDTWVQGICAQLELWRTSAHYRNKRFEDAIRIWSGGNNVPSYIRYVKQRIPGMHEGTVMNDAFWSGPMGPEFLRVQAGHEAGKAIPCDPGDWVRAQQIVFSGKVPMTPAAKKTTATGVGTGTVAVTTAASGAQAGWPWWVVLLVILAGIGITVFAAWFFGREKRLHDSTPVEAPMVIHAGPDNVDAFKIGAKHGLE